MDATYSDLLHLRLLLLHQLEGFESTQSPGVVDVVVGGATEVVDGIDDVGDGVEVEGVVGAVEVVVSSTEARQQIEFLKLTARKVG